MIPTINNDVSTFINHKSYSSSRRIFLLICAILVSCIPESSLAQSIQVIEKEGAAYLANTVVVKLKDTIPVTGKKVSAVESLSSIFESYGMMSAGQLFPFVTKTGSSLNRIHIIHYANDSDPFVVASDIREWDEVEWAEPRILRSPDYVPSDTYLPQQYALEKIKAVEAWGISKGDPGVIIAIIDTGVNWEHPDLAANVWINTGEIPDNGIDDDNNGFIDDVRGWDFGGVDGNADNDPFEDTFTWNHGTHVAGIAGAVTDNNEGIASIGFKSRIMAVKASARNISERFSGIPYIVWGAEGIIYAADNGARIINCSFGGELYSHLEAEAIEYATERGALVIASAGNNNNDFILFPAGLDNVMAVASTDQDDRKSSFSNFGTVIDVSAPGTDIFSTYFKLAYSTAGGTSMAAPLVSGLAALVVEQFPHYTSRQVAEQIRVNADPIDDLNPGYQYMLGSGRINAYKALSNLSSISVRAVEFEILDAAPGGNGNGIPESGETITIGVKFVNYLAAVTDMRITLESLSTNATVQNASFTTGHLATLEAFDNSASMFTVMLDHALDWNQDLVLKLDYSSDGYSDFQLFKVPVNISYATQDANNLALTITSDGALGFNDFGTYQEGRGFHYLRRGSFLSEGGLLVGISSTQVSDAVRDSTGAGRSHDFTVVEPFRIRTPGSISDQQGYGVFNDDAAVSRKIGIEITLQSYTYTNDPHRDYLILKYDIRNTSGTEISTLHAGLLFNWNISTNGVNDISVIDNVGKYAYMYDPSPFPGINDIFIGTALISSDKYKFAHFSNFNTLNTGFQKSTKWYYLSTGSFNTHLNGNNQYSISQMVSGGPFSVQPDETVDVAFAVAVGRSNEELGMIIEEARSKYREMDIVTDIETVDEPLSAFYLSQNYPNPFNASTVIRYSLPEPAEVDLSVYDVLGRRVARLVDARHIAGSYDVHFNSGDLTTGVYMYRLKTGKTVLTGKMLLLK